MWGHHFSLTWVKLFPLSASTSHSTGRDQKCIFESGCYGSGNVAVHLSGCSNMNGRTAERSFGSVSQPAGFLQLLRIAEINLLSLCLGTDSTKAPRSLLLVHFSFFWSVCLLLSALLARDFTHRSLLFWHPGLARPLALFLVFPAIPPTSPLLMSFFLLWPPFHTPWGSGAANSNLQRWINLTFPEPALPLISTEPLRTTPFSPSPSPHPVMFSSISQLYTMKAKLWLYKQNRQITKLIFLW